jgi:hypothetical protein
MRPRNYAFGSVWIIGAPIERCWEFLSSPSQRWLDWWPRLHAIEVHRTQNLVGSRAYCTWQSPLVYRLRTSLTVTDVEERAWIRMTAGGDVNGRAVVSFSELPRGRTRIDVTWWVRTTRAWMNVLAPVLRPVFWWGHRAVMRGGERGLREALTAGSPG